MKLPRTYAERHGEAIFACEMTAGRLPAHGDDARPRVAKGSHWCPPDNARTYASRYPRGASDALAAAASVAASRHSEPRHQTRTPHRPQPVVIALSRSTKTPSRTPSDSLAGMLTVAVPMGA